MEHVLTAQPPNNALQRTPEYGRHRCVVPNLSLWRSAPPSSARSPAALGSGLFIAVEQQEPEAYRSAGQGFINERHAEPAVPSDSLRCARR
jgi:hypothetical protein